MHSVRRRHAVSELRRAVASDELRLGFEPVIEIGSLEVVGFQAMPEWTHADGRITPATELTAVGGRAGVLPTIERWALKEGCRQVGRWNDTNLDDRPLWLAVEISAPHAATPGFERRLREVIDTMGFDPAHLVVELPELLIADPAPALVAQLEALRRSGVRVAISGFGNGRASLADVAAFPADRLAIGRPFVGSLGVLHRAATTVGAMVALAHALECELVAAHVETNAQLDVIQILGCDYAQGPFFARPLAAQEAAGVVRNRSVYMPLI